MNRASDPCGRCGCQRQYHNPPAGYTSSKFRIGLTGTFIQVKAKTCCDSCPHCICFCTGFVEPFDGQPFLRCHYETADHTHDDHYDPAIPSSVTIPSLVPSVPAGISVDSGQPGTRQSSKPQTSTKLKKGPKKKISYKIGSPKNQLRWEP